MYELKNGNTVEIGVDPEKTKTVCDKCFHVSCWQREFLCDDSYGAGTVEMKIVDLLAKQKIHSDWWENVEYYAPVQIGDVIDVTEPPHSSRSPRIRRMKVVSIDGSGTNWIIGVENE